MATVVLNKAEVHRTAAEFALPKVTKVLTQTYSRAKQMVPKRSPRYGDLRPVGRLERSIKQRGPRILATKVSGSVGSTLAYASSVHDGAEAHSIVARRVRLLSFYWESKSLWFVGRHVSHPGIRAFSRTEYLYRPLVIAGRRNGFVVRRLVSGVAAGFADL